MDVQIKPKMMAIVGPTASGKTALSISLAKKYHGEIVSADSRQIYREMNIGTAKPTTIERESARHHLLDIKNPDEEYTVSDYKNDAIAAIHDILRRGKLPIMAGGTGRPIMQSSQMAVVEPGQSFFLTSEDDCRTWSATLDKDFKLTAKLFADRGGNAVVTDRAGNVYIVDGNVFVYGKNGKLKGTLEIPERVSGLAFGGPDKRTLFIGARSSLYSIHTKVPGI